MTSSSIAVFESPKKFSLWAITFFVFIFPILEGYSNEVAAVGTVELGLLVTGIWFAESVMKGVRFGFNAALMLIFIGWHFLTVLWSVDHQSSLERAVAYVMTGLFYFMVYDVARSRRDIGQIFLAYALSLGVLGLTSLQNIVAGTTYSSLHGRYSAMGTDPNNFGIMVTSVIPLVLYLGSLKNKIARAASYFVVAALILIAVATGSRAAVIASALCISGYILLNLKIHEWPKLIPILLLAGVLAAVGIEVLVPAESLNRLENVLNREGEDDRWTVWMVALETGNKNPAFGIGTGAFLTMSGAYQIHNTFLSNFTEAGMVGLALYLMIWGFHSVPLLRNTVPELAEMRNALLLSMGAILIGGLTLNWEVRKPLYLILALSAAFMEVRFRYDLSRAMESSPEPVHPPFALPEPAK
ncbi:MAG: O-antigen ligase family protein [Verrucomicrobiales bacterium]